MAEWFIGPIMDKIINTCSDYLEDQVGWQTGMKEELESLRQNHPKIQAVVFAANQAQISDQNHPINKWIWQLRDAVDEADDVLDEFEYMKHKEQLTKKMEKRTAFANSNFLIESASKIRKVGERALKIDPNLKRLEEVVQKLDKVSVGVSTFLHLLDSAKQEQQEQLRELSEARETGSLPTNDLIGRGEAKEFVMQWLRKPSNEHRGTDLYRNISLLCIVGHGGMGKTTLLQHVYEDEMTKEFDLKMWVCISNNFDVKKVIADMLESLKKERPHLETLEALQDSLRTEIMSKKFLLVLDDIWEEEENRDIRKWEKVFAPLAYGKIGSRILITTRMDSVAMMIAKVIKKKTKIFRLEGLEEDHCLQLLNSHAFADVENPNDYKRLRSIAGEIVKKLLGSPLAAKVIGGVLNSSLDERHWTKVLNSDFVSSKLGQDDIFLILRLSYMFLPKHLQNCFAFCSIFKQDYPFLKDDLVKMWIALGFIQQPHDQEWTMEDIGGMYFDVLVKKSFFDMFEDFGRRYYKLHDLIHELAQSVSIHECLRVEDGKKLPSIIPKTLRHLSVQNTNPDIIKMIGQFKYLHSLFLFNEGSNQDLCNQDLCNALIKIFKASRSLRLLNIWVPKNLEIILKEIGNFLHLRYLRIYENCISSICGIGKLKSLQELNMFDVRDVNGYRIVELENLNDLWKLRINCLENVKDAEEACSAKLCAKMRLIDLTLCWSNTDSRNIDLEEKVLDNLQPPKCLRNLSIKKYMGASSAIWMNNVNPIFNLEKIKLTYCLKCETLPPFGQLPFLKSLTLSNMPKVKWLESKFNGNDKYHAFPSLEVLHISWLTTLEDWFEAGVAAEDGCLFPCLIQLEIENCPKLEELPSLPSKLKSLKIRKIRWKTMNFCSNSNPIPLELLEVSLCPNITSLPLADEIGRLAALRSLKINLSDCLECETLPPFGQLPFLKSLKLWNIPKVKWLESKINGNDKYRAFPLLEVLSIYRLEALEDWFEAGAAAEDGCFFPCLIELEIENCPKLKELPSLPPKLKRLSISNIGWTTLNFCSNSNPIPLQSLLINQCPNITSLPLSDEIARLAALRYLTIIKCPNLISLGRYREVESTNNCHLMLSCLFISDPSVLLMEPLRSIASLKTLSISKNDEVVSFPKSLPSSLESLSSLQKLSILNVRMLRELPNLPPSLERLEIWGCHPELKERYREDGGSDRHKIAHIPNIIISTKR
ncbi:Disease resistance protein RGA2 [Dendrobium catenatum]|uniref:Disease resistance protein RGA2 n=1 Tax=Dendrobium catenatum TaxID=906689 RepID=A0A2I0WTS0_9ASPA|nr:Disease resistance protein RGA2 [Dendrobium catenatum]